VAPRKNRSEQISRNHGGWGCLAHEACYARGIITCDNEWELCFTDREARECRTGLSTVRRLLISAVVYHGLSDASAIWEKFRGDFCVGQRTPSPNKGSSVIQPSMAPAWIMVFSFTRNCSMRWIMSWGPWRNVIFLTSKTTGGLTNSPTR
jgi:hypothetical protein